MKKSKKATTIAILLVFLIGLSLLAYPLVSDQWNKMHQTRAIISHAESIAKMSEEECAALRSAADEFNASLFGIENRWKLAEDVRETYESLLICDETRVISYIEIPKIGVSLPIYHGTGSAVLQTAIGHMEGTSLPVGGAGTHCVLSGHRGLPSAKLFTDLDKLVEGDQFMLYTLDQTLTYEVDQIHIVVPSDMSTLALNSTDDQVTLFTCTPYGINTHRLMVHAHRVQTESANEVLITSEAIQIDQKMVALCIAIPTVFILFLFAVLRPRKKALPEDEEEADRPPEKWKRRKDKPSKKKKAPEEPIPEPV